MTAFNDKIIEKVDELVDKASEKLDEGKTDECLKFLKDAWALFPDPKEDWHEAYNVAKYIFEEYIKSDQASDAKEWLDNMQKINNNLHANDEELLFCTAKYKFEIDKHDDAFEDFDAVVKSAGLRYFEDENPKYLRFYKKNKKGLK
jgi:hypothetical protein